MLTWEDVCPDTVVHHVAVSHVEFSNAASCLEDGEQRFDCLHVIDVAIL